MLPLSCENCCFNALQYDAIGTSFGYCVEYRVVLRHSEALTCGRLLRKDLTLPSAKRESAIHAKTFTTSDVAFLRPNGRSPREAGYADDDTSALDRHDVTKQVAEYGKLHAKIESLAGLRTLPGVRAEVARLALGRTYVDRCVTNGGSWTAGIHQYWWTKERLLDEPSITADDIRVEAPIPLERQVAIAKWAVVMLRLVFMSDIGHHAAKRDRQVAKLRALPERAAMATDAVSCSKLLSWVKREGIDIVEHALPRRKYERLAEKLHKERADGAQPVD
jgi:hypothetical protein